MGNQDEFKATVSPRLEEAAYRLLVDSVVDYAIYILDPEGHVATWNQGAERVKGYAASEILGAPYERFFLPEDVERGKPRALLAEAARSGHATDLGWRQRKDGSRFWAEANITAMRDAEGRLVGYAKVTRDLTERLEAEAVKDQFLNSVTHELRTPLNAVVGFGSLLEDEVLGPLNEAQHMYLQRMLGSAGMLLDLIDDLLDMGRLQAGHFSISARPMALEQIVREVFERLEALARQKAIRLLDALGEDLPALHADPRRIGQVLVNLVSNAIKFSPPGGSITVSARLEGDWVRCAVEDEGVGIAAEDQGRLFRAFSQLEGVQGQQGGTGLGLSISKALIEAHGGSIGVTSTPGHGATFWFTLPVERP